MTYEYRGRVYERDMNAQDFRRAFGYGKKPYPADARDEVMINGRTVCLRPKTKKHMEMRVWTNCPDCGKEIAPGKLRQHMAEQKKWEAPDHWKNRFPGETNRDYRKRIDNPVNLRA